MKKNLIIIVVFLSSLFNLIANEQHEWKKKYSAFGSVAPGAELKQEWVRMFNTRLTDFKLHVASFKDAIPILRTALRKKYKKFGLSFILASPDDKAYDKPIAIDQGSVTLGEAINLACEQTGMTWDFSSIKLTITPKKKTE